MRLLARKDLDEDPLPGWDTQVYIKSRKRVSQLETYQLLDWADAAASGMGKGFQDHRLHGDFESIGEIEAALITLWAVKEELVTRAR